MQDTEFFNNFPPSLAAKVQTYAAQLISKAQNICRHNGVAPDVCDVFIADMLDMLRAKYCGLRATTEQMRALAERVPQRSWDRTEQAPLGFVARYYADIAQRVASGAQLSGYVFTDAVIMHETAKRAPAVVFPGYDEDRAQREAQQLYYAYAVLSIGEWCDVTADELRQITEQGANLNSDKQARLIDEALRAQAWRKQRQQAAQTRTASIPAEQTGDIFPPEKAKYERKTPIKLQPQTTIRQFQNIAFMIGSGIQTAVALPDGRGGIMQPLWQVVEKQKQAALVLIADDKADKNEQQRATQILTDTYAVTQVLDGLQVLPQIIPPDSGSTTRMTWDMSAYEYARTILGIEKPKAEQVTATLRATAFLSRQVIEVEEKYNTRAVAKDNSGAVVLTKGGKPKRIKEERTRKTILQPVVVEFCTEYKNKVLIEEATRIRIEVHRLFIDGRSADYFIDGKKQQYITTPRRNYLTIGQYYDFATESERIFRNIVVSKAHQAEDALLAVIFNYPQRQAEADARAAEAHAVAEQTKVAAEAVAGNPTATPEQIAEAKRQATEADAEARRAAKLAKYHITNHKHEDLQRLKSMFAKATCNGLIKDYRPTTGRDGRIVWEWTRGKDEADTQI